MKFLIWLSGNAPMNPSTGCPRSKANTAGMDWTPSCPAICGCSSMFILTSLTFPLAALTAFSRTGVNCLQGPHQGAQKSTSTGWRADSAITSARNEAVVASLIRSPATPATLSASPSPTISKISSQPETHAGERPPTLGVKWGSRAGETMRFVQKVRNNPSLHPRLASHRSFRHIPVAPTASGCGCSSGVEHNLAKVGVEGSNPFARSKSPTSDCVSFG